MLDVNSYTGLENMRPGLSVKISLCSGSYYVHTSSELGFAWRQNNTGCSLGFSGENRTIIPSGDNRV